jgi:hypothetical protein
VLANYFSTANRAYAEFDSALLGRVEADPLHALEADLISWAKQYGQQPPRGYGTWRPIFWIPRIADGKRRWFVVEKGSGSAGTSNDVVLLFIKQPAGWRASMDIGLASGQHFPKIKLDQHGYATEVKVDDARYVVPPAQLSGRLANTLNTAVARRTGPPADDVFDSGSCTSGVARDEIGQIDSVAKYGWAMTVTTIAVPSNTFALKTTSGALVWLTDRRHGQWANVQRRAGRFYYPTFPGSDKVTAVHYGNALGIGVTVQETAIDPLGGSGHVDMLSCAEWLHDFSGS